MYTTLSLKEKTLLVLLALLVIFPAWFVNESVKPQSCTIFTTVQNGTVLFGNNEDWHSPDPLIGFYPASPIGYGSVHFGFRHSDGAIEFGGAVNDQGLAWDVNSIPRSKLNPHPERPFSHAQDNYLSTITKEAGTVEDAIRLAHKFDFGEAMSLQIHIADATGNAVVIGPGPDGELAFTRKPAGNGYLLSTNFNLATPKKGPKDFRYDTATSMLDKLGISQEPTTAYAGEILAAVHLQTLTSYTLYSNVLDLKNGKIFLYYLSQYNQVIELNLVEELEKGQRIMEMRDLFSAETVEAGEAAYQRFETRFKVARIAAVAVLLGLIAAGVTWAAPFGRCGLALRSAVGTTFDKSRISSAPLSLLLLCIILTACAGQISGADTQSVQRVAITNVTLVPMTKEIILENQTVLIEGSRIAALGLADEISIPKDATIIDGSGAYLMPGLADMHMHTTPAWDTEWPISPFILYLANGVTTVRNLDPLPDASGQNHPSPDYVLAWRSEIQSGKRPGPTMYTTGLSLQGPKDWRPSVLTAGDAQKVVRENVDKGYDFLKIFEYYPKQHFAEAMAAAKELDMYVTGHIPFEVGLEGAVTGGMNEIAHIAPILFWERMGIQVTQEMRRDEFGQRYLQEMLDEWDGVDPEMWYEREKETIKGIVELLRSNGVNICTTGVGPDITKDLISDYDSFLERVDMQYSRRRFLDLISRGEDGAQQVFKQYPDLMEAFIYERNMWVKELKEAGVFLILGTDSGVGMGIVPGFSLHGELLTLIENGFSPYEAIATGTVNASKVVEEMIGVDDFGTIEVGKRADLILVAGNPLEDVANIMNIRGVMAAGRWYTRITLDEMLQLEQ